MSDLPFRSATDLLVALDRRETSSAELLELYLARVDRLAKTTNAVVTLDAERALAEARRCDEAPARRAPRGAPRPPGHRQGLVRDRGSEDDLPAGRPS